MEARKWTWKNVDLPSDVAEKLALKFEAGVYEEAIRGTSWEHAGPYEIGLLVKLGDVYSRLEWLHKGLEVDRLLVKLHPREAIYHYNLACSYSLLGEIDEAFAALSRAIDLGYKNLPLLREDKDLANLKRDERFLKLIEQLESSSEQLESSN
jgi:tetratricopeptide (TPR) repeat protein